MENIRFFSGEKENNEDLAEKIANTFDLYVMDAFATAHRKSASTYGAIKKSKNVCMGMLFSDEITKIDQALSRIDDGSYGYCEDTGEPIGIKRLEARPIATLSIEAQERHEKMEKTQID